MVEDEVLEAVAGYWRTFLVANDLPDPSHPGFRQYLTGEARGKSIANTVERQEMGLAVRLPDESLFQSRPIVTDVSTNSATVVDCLTDDSRLMDPATGAVVSGSTTTSRMRLVLQLTEGGWRVSSNFEEERWEGTGGCAS